MVAVSTMPPLAGMFSVAPSDTPPDSGELAIKTLVPPGVLAYSIAPISTTVAVSFVMVTVCTIGAKPGICADTLKVTGDAGEGDAWAVSDKGKKPCDVLKPEVAPPSICTRAASLPVICTLKSAG